MGDNNGVKNKLMFWERMSNIIGVVTLADLGGDNIITDGIRSC